MPAARARWSPPLRRLVALVASLATWTATAASQPQQSLPSTAGDSMRALIDHALQSNRPADYDGAIAFLDRELAAAPDDAVALHYRGFVLYRKASILVASGGDRALAKRTFEEAGRDLARSDVALPWPETRALRSAALGQLIGLSGATATFRLGPRASRLLDEATTMGPDNPRVWMLRGVSAMFKPRLFGGGLGRAERELQHALSLFASDAPSPPAPWWGHAETYAWLGQLYARQGKVEQAQAAYARALTLEPDNAWVRDQLVPALEKARR